MATFLVNASNLKVGGGLQVADSICGMLAKMEKHQFVIVLSSYLQTTLKRVENENNISAYCYDVPDTISTIVLGRDSFMDSLVEKHHIDAVLTVFGPSRWKPRVPHLSGFAIPHLLIPESPYFKKISWKEKLRLRLYGNVVKWSLKRSADCFWTENPFTTKRLKKLLKSKDVYTVSNYYNQVFDHVDLWERSIRLPEFDGVTCLSVSSPSPHKNFGIIEDIVRYLREVHPEFKVRFVLTCTVEQWPMAQDVRDNVVYVGKTEVSECPFLYEQADIMFMPTLLECFTATYPEAMKMKVPIVTTDMEFAKGLCGDAACYFSVVDSEAAAEAIYKVGMNAEYAHRLVEQGTKQLNTYDSYEQRAVKLVEILEKIKK